MKKFGTVLLLALTLLSVSACGKKKDNNTTANNYCGPQYGYAQGVCGASAYGGQAYNGQYGQQYGQPYGQQYGYGQYGQQGACQIGSVQTQFGCLQQGPCASLGNYGYHPTINNGQPACVLGQTGGYGYQQPYQQQYGW